MSIPNKYLAHHREALKVLGLIIDVKDSHLGNTSTTRNDLEHDSKIARSVPSDFNCAGSTARCFVIDEIE